MSKISVLMSIFNEPLEYIKESIDSILKQSFTDFECIIVLDNPERTEIAPFINEFGDPRLKLFTNEKNVGLAISMNNAAKYAKADVFARMDADDIAETDKLGMGYDAITQKNADVVFSNFQYINEDSAIIEDRFKRGFKEGYVASKEIAIAPNQIHHPTVMMRRSIFEKVGGYRNFPCAQDSDLWMRMQENGAVFYCIEHPLLRYRINPQGTTQMKLFKQQLTTHYIYSLSLERLKKGSDTYSLENYNHYLVSHGLNSLLHNKLFSYGWWSLEKAKNAIFPIDLMLRISAFLFVPHLRNYYLMENKKKRLCESTN